MKLHEAIQIVEKDTKCKPFYGFESDKYFVFHLADNQGQPIINNCSYVVDKKVASGKWIPANAFPLDDSGNTFIEYTHENFTR